MSLTNHRTVHRVHSLGEIFVVDVLWKSDGLGIKISITEKTGLVWTARVDPSVIKSGAQRFGLNDKQFLTSLKRLFEKATISESEGKYVKISRRKKEIKLAFAHSSGDFEVILKLVEGNKDRGNGLASMLQFLLSENLTLNRQLAAEKMKHQQSRINRTKALKDAHHMVDTVLQSEDEVYKLGTALIESKRSKLSELAELAERKEQLHPEDQQQNSGSSVSGKTKFSSTKEPAEPTHHVKRRKVHGDQPSWLTTPSLVRRSTAESQESSDGESPMPRGKGFAMRGIEDIIVSPTISSHNTAYSRRSRNTATLVKSSFEPRVATIDTTSRKEEDSFAVPVEYMQHDSQGSDKHESSQQDQGHKDQESNFSQETDDMLEDL